MKLVKNPYTLFDKMDELRGPPLPIIERYYHKYYAIDVKGIPRADQCILQHSNRVLVVCIAPLHPLVNSEIEIDHIEYQIGKIDRTHNPVSGKYKKGGQKLIPTSPLCIVHVKGDKNDHKFVLYSCVKGTLLEVNEMLLSNPKLLQTHPLGEGYVAIVLPNKVVDADSVCNHLLTSEQYVTLKRDTL